MQATAFEFPLEKEIKEFLLSFERTEKAQRDKDNVEYQFFDLAVRLFRWQYRNNEAYRSFATITEYPKIQI